MLQACWKHRKHLRENIVGAPEVLSINSVLERGPQICLYDCKTSTFIDCGESVCNVHANILVAQSTSGFATYILK